MGLHHNDLIVPVNDQFHGSTYNKPSLYHSLSVQSTVKPLHFRIFTSGLLEVQRKPAPHILNKPQQQTARRRPEHPQKLYLPYFLCLLLTQLLCNVLYFYSIQ